MVNNIMDIPQQRYLSYKNEHIRNYVFKILIVLTLRTFAPNWFHNLAPLIPINTKITNVFRLTIFGVY